MRVIRNSDIVSTITTNVGGRDFIVNLSTDGRFVVEGGLTHGSNWSYSFHAVREAIQHDMEKSLDSYGEPYMSQDERLAMSEDQARAAENAAKREEAAERRATAAELQRVRNVYVFNGPMKLEEVKVRGLAAGRGRGYSSGNGFNVTILPTGEKSQDRQVWRLTPALVDAYNKLVDQHQAVALLTEDIPTLQEVDTRSTFEEDGWIVTVTEHLGWGRHNRGREAVEYARHAVKYDEQRNVFMADNAIFAESLNALELRLAAMVHPALGKWIVYEEEGRVTMVEVTADVIANLQRQYRYVEVVEDEIAAQAVVGYRIKASELKRRSDRIRSTIINHPSYVGLVRDEIDQWPVLDIDIIPAD